MTSSETTIKYGVSTRETSIELDWKNETLFHWLGEHLCARLHYNDIVKEWIAYDVETDIMLHSKNKSGFIPAPQMHEIARELPADFYTDCGQHIFYELNNRIGYGLHIKQGKVESTTIRNHHYAEAYAKLHIKLREAGLLKKEAGNVLD